MDTTSVLEALRQWRANFDEAPAIHYGLHVARFATEVSEVKEMERLPKQQNAFYHLRNVEDALEECGAIREVFEFAKKTCPVDFENKCRIWKKLSLKIHSEMPRGTFCEVIFNLF